MILSVYVPPLKPYDSTKYEVVQVQADGLYDYSHAVNHQWEVGLPFVNIEHDMEADDERVAELLACSNPNCCFAYRIYRVHHIHATEGHIGSLTQPAIYAQSSWVELTNGDRVCRPIEQGTTRSYHSAIGLAKITPTNEPLAIVPWWEVEVQINRQIHDWHIHWPEVDHYHK